MLTPLLVALLLPAAAAAEPAAAPPHPAEAAGDEALTDLAAGRPQAAVRRIRRLLAASTDEGEQQALRCMMGRAQRRAGDEAGAVDTLAQVPLTAACGPRAAFDRADALLALGRSGEAAALYATAGAGALGEGRDIASAATLSRLAHKVLADPDQDDLLAQTLLGMALDLHLPQDQRVALAEELAGLVVAAVDDNQRVASGTGLKAHDVLLARLRAIEPLAPEDDARLRRLATRLLGDEALLAPLADDQPTRLTRALTALRRDPHRGAVLLAQVVEGAPEDRELRARLARSLVQAESLSEARPHWQRLAGGDDELAAEALLAVAHLELRAGEGAAAEATLVDWLRRFPTSAERSTVDALLAETRLAAARRLLTPDARAPRPAEAVVAYDAFVRAHPTHHAVSDAAWEAGVAARAAGDLADARARWEELVARQPHTAAAHRALSSLARSQAIDQGQLDAALAWLRTLTDEGGPLSGPAASEAARLTEESLAVEVTGRLDPREPTVRVHARNLSQVQVRLHRIDPEAFLRAGGSPDSLPELDVAVIAPDREWTATVPETPRGQDVAFDLPLRTPGVGLYAVTVATAQREARAIALVGDTTLLARARGADLVVGALRGDRAASGLRVLVAHGDEVSEARTGGDGLARLDIDDGSAVILADGPGGPALLSLLWPGAASGDPQVRADVELDRPTYLPGDRVGLRLVARLDDAPLAGTWELWLQHGSVTHPSLEIRADRRGIALTELSLPALEISGAWSLMGIAPGEDQPRELALIPVVSQGAPVRTIRVQQEGTAGQVLVREADGRPAVDVPVTLTLGEGREDELAHTDAAGRIEVMGPGEGVSWALSASLPGVPGWTSARGTEVVVEPLTASVDQDRPESGQPVLLRLGGEVPAQVALYRVLEPVPPAVAPADPWQPTLDQTLEGPRTWSGQAPPLDARAGLLLDRTWQGPGAADLDLGTLESGRWLLRVVPLTPGQATIELPLLVEAAGPRIGAVSATLAAGSRVDLPVSGPALVTAEGQGIDAAAIVGARGHLRLDVPWEDRSLQLVATGADAVHARQVEVDASIDVALEVAEVDGRWQIDATVTGPDGRPVQAQVSLAASDLRLHERHQPALLDAALLRPVSTWGSAGGVASDLRHAAWAQAISAALLAESARVAEAQRAAAAARGRLSAGLLDEVMAEEPMELGGLGTRGYGSGGGGYGSGSGVGGLGGGAIVLGASGRREPLRAVRERVLWQVAETDSQGRLSVTVDRPPAATFQVRATAVTAEAVGLASVEHDGAARPYLSVAPLAAGAEGDLARPQVHVVNGGDRALSAVLRLGERVEGVALNPGEAQTVQLDPLAPGQRVSAVLETQGAGAAAVLDQALIVHPVAIGADDPDGRLLRVAVGPGGGLPLEALAAEDDPLAPADVGRAARAGRAALIGAGVMRGDARQRLLDRARQHLAAVRTRGLRADTAVDQAELLVFLVEAGAALPEIRIPRGELDGAADHLDALSRDSHDRVAQTWALAVAGREIDQTRLGRLLRDAASLDAETRSWLARGLVALGRAEDALGLIDGDGPLASAARRELGLPVSPTAPPPVGHVDRAHWLTAAAVAPGRARGSARVLVSGQVAGTLDLATGGELRALLPLGATVSVEGAPDALVQRSATPAGVAGLRAARAPVGVDGRPVLSDLPAAPECGTAQAPCLLAVGDALRLQATRTATTVVPSGLRWDRELRATQPGDFVLAGLTLTVDGEEQAAAPLHITVTPTADTALSQSAALALAEQAAAAEADPLPLLAPWPGFDDWREDLRPRALRLRFDAAAQAELVPAFEALRDGAPAAAMDLPDVAAVARAYAAADRPDRAVDVWRAGLGAAFLAEAGPARRIEDVAGRLVSLKAMRELTLRYPSVPVVDEAEFHLPERLAALIEEGIPSQLSEEGITATDVRLLAAAWDREFLALHPDSPLAPQAGFHLVQGLLRLRAFDAAAEWAGRVAEASADAPVLDGLRYVEGLALSELGRDAQARKLLEQLATGDWPQEDGSLGPAGLRPDARYALGRLAEARGDLDGARDAYDQVRSQFSEAERALQALTLVALSPDPLVTLAAGDAAVLPVRLANVDTVHLRAYRLDLRTVFLRDGGLDSAASIEVSGVSPAWSGRRDVRDDPFPVVDELALPLTGSGAWLIQLDAEGQEATALVVRSALSLSAEDGSGGRRLVVRRGEQPAAGAEVRALDRYGQVVATKTDIRGVAMVPAGAAALVFDGEDVAFTDPLEIPVQDTWYDFDDTGVEGDLMQNIDQRVKRQRSLNEANYQEQYAPEPSAAVQASML